MTPASRCRSMGSRLLKMSAALVLGLIGLGLGIVSLCGAFFWVVDGVMCGSDVLQEVYSPNGKYRVVVFQRDCGATTGFATHIAVLKGNTSLGRHYGNVFQAPGHPDWFEIKVEWQDDTHLTIEHNGKPIPYVAETEVRGIEIEYVENREGIVSARPFEPRELLLPASLFPQGWTGEELRPIGSEEIRGSKENHPYMLYTPPGSGYHEAGHYVWRLDNSEKASAVFEGERTALQDCYPMGSNHAGKPLPDAISYRSSYIEDFAIYCTEHRYGSSGPPRCRMVAQYEEFFIDFESTVAVHYGLTYEQFNELVEAIDEIMVRHLE